MSDFWCLIAVLSKLLQEFPDKFAKAITHTTRKPRTNEIPGVHYYFTTREEMEKQIKNGEFIGNVSPLSSTWNLWSSSFLLLVVLVLNHPLFLSCRKCRGSWESVWIKYQSCSWCCTSRKDMSLGNWCSGDFFFHREDSLLFSVQRSRDLSLFQKKCCFVCLRGFLEKLFGRILSFLLMLKNEWHVIKWQLVCCGRFSSNLFVLFLCDCNKETFEFFSLIVSLCFCCEWQWMEMWTGLRVVKSAGEGTQLRAVFYFYSSSVFGRTQTTSQRKVTCCFYCHCIYFCLLYHNHSGLSLSHPHSHSHYLYLFLFLFSAQSHWEWWRYQHSVKDCRTWNEISWQSGFLWQGDCEWFIGESLQRTEGIHPNAWGTETNNENKACRREKWVW